MKVGIAMLTDRQMRILRMIVDDYIRSAEPIGSRTLSKQMALDVSAATIRNEMADLEELGYLEQPHTSAGRVPSQQGYRYYVDHLLSEEAVLTPEDVKGIRSLFSERIVEMERVAREAAVMISDLTRYTGVVLGPQVYDTTLKKLEIIPLNERSAVVLIVTSAGAVQNKTVTLPEGISPADVERLFSILNHRLAGTPMYRIRSRVLQEITSEIARHVEDYEEAMKLLDRILPALTGERDARVYLGGATNMLEQPEFRDLQRVRAVLSWLEQPSHVAEALRGDERGLEHLPGVRVKVRIGGENGAGTLQDCSLITATYAVGDVPIGVIGVIGPTRMEYARVMRLMKALSDNMTDVFSRFYQT